MRREDVTQAPELRDVVTAIEDTRMSCGRNGVSHVEMKENLLQEFGINEVSHPGRRVRNSNFIQALQVKERQDGHRLEDRHSNFLRATSNQAKNAENAPEAPNHSDTGDPRY